MLPEIRNFSTLESILTVEKKSDVCIYARVPINVVNVMWNKVLIKQ